MLLNSAKAIGVLSGVATIPISFLLLSIFASIAASCIVFGVAAGVDYVFE